MDSGDLKVFEAVARLGGMNRAAAALNTVQSNVTARIRHLEEELGERLFDRHSRGVTPTDAARRLLPFAARIAGLIGEARRAVRDDGKPGGSLSIGSLETTAALRLSPILTRYAAAYPDVDLALTTGTSEEMIDSVLSHRLEGAFVCGPVRHARLIETTIFHEELVLVTAPGHRELDLALASPALKIIVLRAGCSYRSRLETLLSRRGIVALRCLEFGTLDTILGCVAAGIGVTLLPRSVVQRAEDAGQVSLHTLPRIDAQADTLFIRCADGYVSSALAAFLEMAQLPAGRAAA